MKCENVHSLYRYLSRQYFRIDTMPAEQWNPEDYEPTVTHRCSYFTNQRPCCKEKFGQHLKTVVVFHVNNDTATAAILLKFCGRFGHVQEMRNMGTSYYFIQFKEVSAVTSIIKGYSSKLYNIPSLRRMKVEIAKTNVNAKIVWG
jgi:hypothetical protein